ncbi:hypothetical protein JRO89_XS07G0050000 [Xanthoceras sorbifolium]|uniref:Response regulatory domain-containing protein n=1 Tax=Xanthoceras sorbifolium TaxID=99658 RepID=A0ABQ8HSJ5_9ROSI|nr:hypothetical protein JRO89_XS07G0050000 [Xanthoceras sorbifolium]
MAMAGETYRSTAGCEELHILAVDDSFVDRKVIERLLKMSSCKVTAVEWNESSAVSGVGERRGLVDEIENGKKVILFALNPWLPVVAGFQGESDNATMLGMTGSELLKKIKALKVNLILPDYFMPGMTGSELLKKIKESSAFKEIRVVIMSSENIIVRIVTAAAAEATAAVEVAAAAVDAKAAATMASSATAAPAAATG